MGNAIVILGAGTGGTIMANRLRKKYKPNEATITVIDQNDRHIYQPGLLFVPFGIYQPEDIVRPRGKQLHKDIDYIQASIDALDVEGKSVSLGNGQSVSYDLLIIATGTRLLPEETEGLTGTGWRENIFDFYTLEGAVALHDKLANFEGGDVVVGLIDLPIKCPVAPLEFTFLADWYFTERGIRDEVNLTYVTSLDAVFTKPVAAEHLGKLMAEKNINVVTDFVTGEVNGADGKLVSFDEREVPFDLLVTIPLHGGADFVEGVPGLGDPLNFVKVDTHTMQSTAYPDIFAIGDVASLPTSKAGSVTHFEADVLVDNIVDHLAGSEISGSFDGHANCFIETGFNKALLIDFNYETEPLPGRFPFAGGPMPLMKESRLNHIGKLMFHPVYWNMLLPGHHMPGIPTDMPTSGKKFPQPQE
jgi:sulfide:quinone oxidoreductase